LRDDTVTTRRERSCPACGLTFVADRPRVWCSNACRQRGYRIRCRPPADTVVVLPVLLPKAAVVYECPECETRYVGVQRCEGCHVFCRRLGPGGPCPHCDEAVAVTDLIAGASAR
jgi:hypothetical protein